MPQTKITNNETDETTTRLKSNIITATRDGSGANADVAYTGVGFTPTSIQCLAIRSGTLYQSTGFSDQSRDSSNIHQSAANVWYYGAGLAVYTDQNNWAQAAAVKSYDSDGFTLTWTKTGSPAAGTIDLTFICYR